MQHERASFWADIKYYEEQLARNPDSFLFARLSDAFLKLNLVDDALHVARQGVAKYPAYVAGQRALALACHAKGLVDESRQVLEAVAAAVPEDMEIQKLLGKLYRAFGDRDGARRVCRVLLDFYPDDAECREELKSLDQPPPAVVEEMAALGVEPVAVPGISPEAPSVEEEDVIDLDDADILLEEVEEEAPVSATVPHHDPLSTATLAELYVQQGFLSKALDIYRSLSSEDPTNGTTLARIAELQALQTAEEPGAGSVAMVPLCQPAPPRAVQGAAVLPPGIPARGEADAAVAALEGWLDSIRRIKACR
jgi:tetratricopeptide (TPR) repeat protein